MLNNQYLYNCTDLNTAINQITCYFFEWIEAFYMVCIHLSQHQQQHQNLIQATQSNKDDQGVNGIYYSYYLFTDNQLACITYFCTR